MKLYIPAYTIEDIDTFCPLGAWQLVSVNDHSRVLATMFNADLSSLRPLILPTHTQPGAVGLLDELTAPLAEAG